MTLKTQKIISTTLIFFAVAFSFAVLTIIVNLNQPTIFLKTAVVVWLYIWLKIALLYDLHFKYHGKSKSLTPHMWMDALKDRFDHLLHWKYYSQALIYLLLPGILFWSTVTLLYVEMGHEKLQYIFAVLSTIALTVNYAYIKEAFLRKQEKLDRDIFIALSVVKVYTSALMFAASISIMRRFCLDPELFVMAIFCIVFLLLYPALWQHKLITIKNILYILGISAVLSLVSYYIYIYWGYNFVTAAIFFAVIYNLFWGIFHYHLDKALTRKTLFEIILVCAILAYMVLSITNFRAQIVDGCVFLR